MKIKISVENNEKLQEAIDSIRNKKQEIHLLTVDDIHRAKDIAEIRANGLLKKHWKNICYYFSTNTEKANAYKYRYQADTATISFSSGDWFVTAIVRKEFWPNQTNQSRLFWDLPPEKYAERKTEIKDFLFKNFIERPL